MTRRASPAFAVVFGLFASAFGCELGENGLAIDAAVFDSSGNDGFVTDAGGPDVDASPPADSGNDVVDSAPIDVPQTIIGLQAWYRSDLGITLDPTVSMWADQSGLGDSHRNLVQPAMAKQPTFTASDPAFNSHGSVSTTFGTSTWLATETWSVPLTQPFTVFAVARLTSTANAWLFDNNGSGEVGISSNGSVGSLRLFAAQYGADITAPMDMTYCLIAVFDSATSNTRLNVSQNTQPAGANIGGNAPSPLLVGDAFSDTVGAYAGWTLAELAFYQGALPSTSIMALNSYAAARYKLAIGP